MAIYYLPIEDTTSSCTTDSLLQFVSPSRREQIGSYRFSIDQKLCLYAALLVRYCISTTYQISPKEIQFFAKRFHKPFCTTYPELDFSLSHTHGRILLGLSNSGVIGVDVEQNKNAPFSIMPSAFHSKEIEYIESIPSERDLRFFQIWTQKEAYTKAYGTGLSADLTSIDTLKYSDHIRSWSENSYVYSVYQEYNFPDTPIMISEKELLLFYHNFGKCSEE